MIEYVKKYEDRNQNMNMNIEYEICLYGQITPEFLGLRIRNVQGVVFI